MTNETIQINKGFEIENAKIKTLKQEIDALKEKMKEEKKKKKEERFKQKAIKKVMRTEKAKERLQLKINYHERLLKVYKEKLNKLCLKDYLK